MVHVLIVDVTSRMEAAMEDTGGGGAGSGLDSLDSIALFLFLLSFLSFLSRLLSAPLVDKCLGAEVRRGIQIRRGGNLDYTL